MANKILTLKSAHVGARPKFLQNYIKNFNPPNELILFYPKIYTQTFPKCISNTFLQLVAVFYMIICGNGYLKQQNIRNSTKSTIFPQIRAFVLGNPSIFTISPTVHPPRILHASSIHLACIQLVSSLYLAYLQARWKLDTSQMRGGRKEAQRAEKRPSYRKKRNAQKQQKCTRSWIAIISSCPANGCFGPICRSGLWSY